ncbi:hypothetical protein [Antarcticimicrobium luteum]|uniref:Uncharacterized protein n=1 Tax=Antarcticimicrobium luteum TaxID=2547397 RepID=A0A4V6PM08_9RHOB|nr:hypothetical protein [Antarcticimicrobium luteum]TDK41247.1 hypothetical protein E1832_21395 [Antarcticimicrobium luteum]
MRDIILAIGLTVGLAACTPPGGPAPEPAHAPDPALGQGAFVGAPPAPGRTAAERAARRTYFSGPRGHEF